MRRMVILPAVIIVLVACYRESRDYAKSGPPEATTTVTPTTAGADNTALNPVNAPQLDFPTKRSGEAATATQPVELSEYSIHMPQTLTAGAQTFKIVNAGKRKHSFEIEGNGIEVKLPTDLPAGDQATLEVMLKPGTYTVYCPVDHHKGKGMSTTLTVK